MKRQAKIELFLSDARGIYIPRDFAECVKRDRISGVTAEDLDYLATGPDGEHYWDTWSYVCDNAILTGDDGTQYRIHQDGDCWLVEKDAEYDESSDFDLGYYVDDGKGQRAPSAWASYLVNGDASGITDEEQKQADEWVASVNLGPVVGCEEAGLIEYHDARNVCAYAADCQRYLFQGEI